MDKLKKANDYREKNKVDYKELPEFHVAPQVGWINDPNGFSYYEGMVHLFYQFHPYSKEWGPMHWGHCVSSDLIKWEYYPVALAPDMKYDMDGCFSGSAIETDEGHMLVYTGVTHEENDGKKNEYQNQCVALGDGKSYKKIENNPAINGEIMPQNFSREHFRDPKVWKEMMDIILLLEIKQMMVNLRLFCSTRKICMIGDMFLYWQRMLPENMEQCGSVLISLR